ncbi:Branched-chain amino acid transport protein (AzlD) [Corynebacterium canis]|nr:Branched-chain amino acid transport protein (AzlD) [Corynebacterium canis]
MMGLPPGVDLGYTAAVLLGIGTVTYLLRALPFRLLNYLKGSDFLAMLSITMPVGVMLILVVFTAPSFSWKVAAAVLLTVGLHLWRRSAALSIVTGTAAYVALLQI